MTSFTDKHRDAYGVAPVCAALPIAPSTHYKQKARQADPSGLSQRARRDAVLCKDIERVWRELGLTETVRGRKHRTTIPEEVARVQWT